jgi:hypothetical protein
VADGFITIIICSQLPSTHTRYAGTDCGDLTALGAVLRVLPKSGGADRAPR